MPKGSTRITPVGQACIDALVEFRGRPLRQIARILAHRHPTMFPSGPEHARKALGRYAGWSGTNVNQEAHKMTRPKGEAGGNAWADLMPDTWMSGPKTWKLPKAVERCLVLSDIHVPFHDPAALRIAIEYGIAQKPDAVLLNGDTMDFYAVSFHERDPRKVDWQGELDGGRKLLHMLRTAFPDIPIYFKAGNHEIRLERHLMQHAPILLGAPEFELPSLLRFGEYGIEYIPNKTNVYAGKLNIIHGDEYKGSGGVNPARWLSLRTGEPALCGHFHRTSAHMDRTIRHDVRGWWSTGCLCELTPDYLPYNQWNHGFAIVHINKDGTFEVENLGIIEGKVR